MTNRFMVSVAALALIAGTGLASAQGMNKESGGASAGASGGATMQQHQGESGSAKGSAKGSAETKGMTTGQASGQAEQKSSGEHAQSQSKSGESKSGESKSGEMNQRAEEKGKGHESSQRAEEQNKGSKANQRAEERNKGNETNQRAEERGKGNDANMKAEGRENNKSGTAENKSMNEGARTTTGQAGAGAKLSTEQRTKITSVIRGEHVAPANNVNFSVAVGTRVPREGITLHRLPTEVVSIYPEWRGYEYILVRDEIVVIDPATYEIVAVLNV